MDDSQQSIPVSDGPGASRPFARDPMKLLAFVLLFLAMGNGWQYSERWAGLDFYQFWVAGQSVQEQETGNIYSQPERDRVGALWHARAQTAAAERSPQDRGIHKQSVVSERRRQLETYATPWLYTLFGVASTGDYYRDLARFQALSLLTYALSIFGIAWLLGFSPASCALLVMLFLSWFGPALSDSRVVNVNRLQLGMLAAYLLVRSRHRWASRDLIAGFVLGLATLFKPNLVFVVGALGMSWVILGRWRRLVRESIGMAVAVALGVGISSCWFGSAAAWWNWMAVMPELMLESDHSIAKGNYALSRILEEHVGWSNTPLMLVTSLGAVGVMLWRMRRHRPAGGSEVEPQSELRLDVLMVGLGAAVSVLTAKLAWLHYFVLVIPLALYLLRPVASQRADALRPWLRALAALSIMGLAFEWARPLLGLDTATSAALLVAGGTACLFVLALFDGMHPSPTDEVG